MTANVSVITPSYNTEKHLSQTIESVLNQTFDNWEMIIVDDCSTDKSLHVAKEYSKKDNRIKIQKLSSNSGPAVARNRGIEIAEGKYIAFLDSDDLWKPKKLEKQIQFMEKNKHAFTYTYYKTIDENGNEIGETIKPPNKLNYKDLLKSNQIGCLTAIYDSTRVGKIYMPQIVKRQDYGLWLRILKIQDYAYCLSEPLAYYRKRTDSISDNKIELLKYNWKLFSEIENLSKVQALYYLGLNIANKVFKAKG